jgi:tetratricopeptide (TPR) repeat protein
MARNRADLAVVGWDVGCGQGMYFEAMHNWERAGEVYSKMLERDPSNEMALKRQVALAKAKGSTPAAIEALVAFLEVYCNDIEAWEELADLYLQGCMYRLVGALPFCLSP